MVALAAAETGALGEREFHRIRQLIRARAGIELPDSKRTLVQTRLIRRLRALGIASFAAYVRLLEDEASPEHGELINAITTNVTAFFREPHHFELVRTLLPKLAATGQRIRLWSAGCSSGEEPWSLAITVREALGPAPKVDVKILATDIDTEVLRRAREGVYEDANVEPVAPALLKRHFARGTGANAGRWRIADDLRGLVAFKQLNLFAPWPMHGPFDLIACRNVIIYFDAENKARLIRRYHDLLAPGGHLLLGHSESIAAGVEGFTLAGRTAYIRTAR